MVNNNLPRIERGATRIVVPHIEGETAFIHPSQGPHNYQTVGRGIIARNLKVPNGDYTASLVHAAYCSEAKDEPEFKEIRGIMKGRWLWVFNRNLWTPEGLYVVSDPEAKGLSEQLNPNDLEKRLKGSKEIQGIRFSKDGSVRFAPKQSYNLGEHTAEELSTQGDVIANYGIEGAKKIGEVASKFRYKPITHGINVNEDGKPALRVAGLDSSGGVDVDGLRVDGDWDDGDLGYAFGVSD
jgi:hypothetical protein